MSKNTKLPARERRHQGLAVQTSDAFDPAWNIFRPATSGWPFTPQDFPPLAWWRTLPSNLLRDAEHLLVIGTLDTIFVMDRHNEFAAALSGDAAAAVGVALSLQPIHEVTLTVDIAMTALLRCALGGDGTAILVLANLLRRVKLDHRLAAELSASWHTLLASGTRASRGQYSRRGDSLMAPLAETGRRRTEHEHRQ
jgi:hypothetical protein